MTYIFDVLASPEISDLMRTLSDPTRRAIFERIAAAPETTVGALTRAGRVSQPAVSQHVKALLEARLIVGRREGRNIFYRTDARGLAPLADWVQHYERLWAQSFDRLDDYLQTMQRNETNP
jgi:DNA-binding transcriptional ArsR family regulator